MNSNMNNQNHWYTIQNIDKVDTPAFVVYKERIIHNIEALLKTVKGPEWVRPHVKTHKMAEVTLLMMKAGIWKFKCSTIAEAEMLGSVGARDVLLAFQPVGPKIHRLLRLAQLYPDTRYSCILDNEASAAAISQVFVAAGRKIDVYLDLNVGMNRTGIKPGIEAFGLYNFCKSLPGLNPVGLHVYDGHLRDTDEEVRKKKSDLCLKPVLALSKGIEAAGNCKPVIIAGGSPTFGIHAQRKEVECSPGTFVFWDWGYGSLFPEMPFVPAALVLTRMISRVDEETICLDLGHKSIASENPFPRVHFLNAPEAVQVSQSEEHLVLKVAPQHSYSVGDLFYGIPHHVCPTCALYEKALVVEEGQITDSWKVMARDRSLSV